MRRLRLVLLLTMLFAAVLCLRLRGIDWLLPHMPEPDPHLAAQVEVFRSGKAEWKTSRDYGSYPYLLARMVAVLPEPGIPRQSDGAEAHLRRAMGTLLETRRLVAVLGAAMVPMTFLLARRFLDRPAALMAAGWIAFSLLHQHYAQQARPHVPSAAFTLLAVLACLRLRERPSAANHCLAGGAAALALGTLHNGIAVLFPLSAARLLARRGAGGTPWVIALPALVVPLGMMLVWSYPFLFADGGIWRLFAPDSAGPRLAAHSSFDWAAFDGSGFQKVLAGLWSFEPLAVVFAALGLTAGLARRGGTAPEDRGDLLVVLAYVVPYLIANGLYAWIYPRFLLPLTPFLACAAAHGARVACGRRAGAFALLAPAILALPAWATWRLAALRDAPDTIERAAAWIAEHSAPGQRVLTGTGIVMPLFTKPEDVRADAELLPGIRPYPWIEYQQELLATPGAWTALFDGARSIRFVPLRGRHDLLELTRDPGDWLRRQAADYLVLQLQDKRGDAATKKLHAAAVAHGELVARFSAETLPAREIHPFAYIEEPSQEPFHFGLRTLRARAVGPAIEIHRLGELGKE